MSSILNIIQMNSHYLVRNQYNQPKQLRGVTSMSNSTRFTTADQVKEYLNIPDFRHVTRDKLIQFVSLIPDMDREVAIKTIEQFPEFCGCATIMVRHYESMCDSILTKNGNSVQSVMDGYKQTLEILKDLASANDIDSTDKRYFAEKMVDVADKMAALDTRNKEFLAGVLKGITCFVAAVILICAAVLGVRVKGTEIPHLE